MDKKLVKILVIGVVILLLVIVGVFISRVFSPESRTPECEAKYVAEYGSADCEAALDIEE